jgi:uncharacterized protein (TIGR03382 family)
VFAFARESRASRLMRRGLRASISAARRRAVGARFRSLRRRRRERGEPKIDQGEETMRFTKQSAFLMTAGASILAAQAAQASWTLGNGDTLSFSELFAAGSDRTVYIDDKKFVFESFASAHFQLQDITLIGFISLNGNGHGFRNVGFDLAGGWGDTTPGDDNISEANLQYTVEVNPDAYEWGLRLCDMKATFNGDASGIGSYARVDESVFDLDTNTFLGQLSIYDFYGPPQEERLVDYRDFCEQNPDGFRALEVNKDFKFYAQDENHFASASFIRQEFSQIPAPGALALLGLAGAVGSRRRRA